MVADNSEPTKIFSSLQNSITRAIDVMIVGKHPSVCGHGDDCASALRGSGSRMLFAECDPFCALQACFEGVQA